MTISLFFSAFVMGLLGSGHCLAMCGGVASSLSIAVKDKSRIPLFTLLYNVGRITSYMVAGFIVALLGAEFASRSNVFSSAMAIVSAIFMILVGIYVMRLAATLNWIERAGKALIWRHLVKLNKYVMPIDKPNKAFFYGVLWGWLPCGLVYSALMWTVSLPNAYSGALFMLAFALGTAPAMVSLGVAHQTINKILNNLVIRLILGNILLFYGLYLLLIALL